MKNKLLTITVLSAAVLALSVGCSGTPPPEPAPGEARMPAAGAGIALEINNDLPTTVDCAIEAPDRPRRILGTMLSNSRQTFIIDTSRIAVGFRVLCHRQTGQSVRSDPIRTISKAKITYTLSTGLVLIQSLP